jgi:hypothetical protein
MVEMEPDLDEDERDQLYLTLKAGLPANSDASRISDNKIVISFWGSREQGGAIERFIKGLKGIESVELL